MMPMTLHQKERKEKTQRHDSPFLCLHQIEGRGVAVAVAMTWTC